MDLILLGFVATTLTTVSILPQVIKVIKLKETKDLSLLYWGILAGGLFLWCIYGVLKQDAPIVISNYISLMLSLLMIGLKLKEKEVTFMRRLIMFKAVDCPISKNAISIEVCADCKYKGVIERTNWQMWCKYLEGEPK